MSELIFCLRFQSFLIALHVQSEELCATGSLRHLLARFPDMR